MNGKKNGVVSHPYNQSFFMVPKFLWNY